MRGHDLTITTREMEGAFAGTREYFGTCQCRAPISNAFTVRVDLVTTLWLKHLRGVELGAKAARDGGS